MAYGEAINCMERRRRWTAFIIKYCISIKGRLKKKPLIRLAYIGNMTIEGKLEIAVKCFKSQISTGCYLIITGSKGGKRLAIQTSGWEDLNLRPPEPHSSPRKGEIRLPPFVTKFITKQRLGSDGKRIWQVRTILAVLFVILNLPMSWRLQYI